MSKTFINCSTQCILLVAIICFPVPSQSTLAQRSIDPETQQKIDDFIQNIFLPQSGISGLGLSVVQNDGELLYTTGYGPANIDKGILIGNDTQFSIASTTKSLTGVVVAKTLHERFPDLGEAVLDTPIRKLIPEVNFTLIDRFRSEYTTFRDLLAHRLCLHREDITLLAGSMRSTEEVVYRARYNQEICGMRSEVQYNNQLYAVAGEMIGKVANTSYEDLVHDFLIELGMLNSTFVHGSDDFEEMPYRAMPYYIRDNETLPFNWRLSKRIEFQNAAGGLMTTPNDMARYMRFHLNMGSLDGRQIVPKEVMEWTRKPATLYPSYFFKNSEEDKVISQFGYGLGLIMSAYDGWEIVEHGGSLPPFLTQMTMVPAKGLGIYSSTNMGSMGVNQMVVHAFIFETLMGNDNATEKALKVGEQMEAATTEKNEKDAKELRKIYKQLSQKVTKREKVVRNIVGQYGSGSAGELEISERFNEQTNRTEYYLEHGIWYRGWLEEQADEGIYKINWDTDVIHDDYVMEYYEGSAFLGVVDDTVTIFGIPLFGPTTFKLGERLELLPPVPWRPDSCGP